MKRVGVAELKAGFSRYLRTVRRGGEIVVCDRDRPIPCFVPYRDGQELAPIIVQEPKGSLKEWRRTNRIELPFDIVELLLENRARR